VHKIEQQAEFKTERLLVKLEVSPMRTGIAVTATIFTTLLMLAGSGSAQTPQTPTTLVIAGHAGEVKILQVGGKSYVEVEALARLTKGTLSFKDNRTTLTLPPTDPEAPTPQPQVKAGFSRPFVQAAIEELGSITEWRTGIVSAVEKNIPLSEEWASAQHRQAEKNLALASAAVSTEDDRSSFPLLSSELDHMQKLSDNYLALLKQSAAMSPDNFGNSALEEQILSCAKGFVAMTESRQFQDQAPCH
jgi:hypothetical protein